MKIFKGMELGTGIAVGIGAALLAPIVIPALTGILRPVAKGAIKGVLVLFEKGKEIAAETKEMVEDLAAEAQDELAREHKEASAAPIEGA